MANQITHIVLASKIFPEYDNSDFLIATVFPDIRYLGVIPRDLTHLKEVSLNDFVNEKDLFKAGIKYHSLVDLFSEQYREKSGVYDLIPNNTNSVRALKIFEDEVLYSKIEDWKSLAEKMVSMVDGEREYGIDENKIIEWNKIISDYISFGVNDNTINDLMRRIGLKEVDRLEIIAYLVDIRKNKDVRKIVMNMYDNWESVIK